MTGKGNMKRTSQPTIACDSPWKQIIEDLFEQFLEFFFPQIYIDIDFSRGYEVISKELYKLLKDQNIGKRYTDELIKVYLKDGSEKWLLIHIEVQNYKEKEFSKRMYRYNYRIFDRYGHEVISLVVFTDPDVSYMPDTYKHERWDFKHIMKFPVVKIINFKKQTAELERMSHPMAIVVLAQLQHLELKEKKPGEKYDIKIMLIRMLFRKGFTKEYIFKIFQFIDWLILLPKNLDDKITTELKKLGEEETMTYVTHMERIAEKRGKKEGKMEVAGKMLGKGYPVEDIMEITGLSEKVILALKEKIGQ